MDKTFLNIIILQLIFLTSIYSQEIDSFVPKNYESDIVVYGHLNNDTLTDCAFIARNLEDREDIFLIVLLKKSKETYALSLKTQDFLTVRYGNDIEIKNQSLVISYEHLGGGITTGDYTLNLKNNDWVVLKYSSNHDDGESNSWSNKIDFETGQFYVNHTIFTVDEKEKKREVEGKLIGCFPKSIKKQKIFDILTIKYQHKEYYLSSRNTLWSNDDIKNTLPKEYKLILGNWHFENDDRIYISFQLNGIFYFQDFNIPKNKSEYLQGRYGIKNKIITLYYGDRKSQKFKLILVNNKYHIVKSDGYDFVFEP